MTVTTLTARCLYDQFKGSLPAVYRSVSHSQHPPLCTVAHRSEYSILLSHTLERLNAMPGGIGGIGAEDENTDG